MTLQRAANAKHFLFHRKAAESEKIKYFSFAVERSAKEKDQSLRDIFLQQMLTGLATCCFPSSQRKTTKK